MDTDKIKKLPLEQKQVIADLLILARIQTLERILIEKGIITSEEFEKIFKEEQKEYFNDPRIKPYI